jgi:hypothetical protein
MRLHRLVPIVSLTLLLLTPFAAPAQTQTPAPAASSEQLLKPEELEALVAPIALYPDSLLSLVIMASTYPLELVQADRWIKENKKLKGEALSTAVGKQPWDESVKSLAAAPDVVAMMSSKLDWTTKLGDAVLAQQPDVMDAIQRLRAKAEANNKLTSNKQQTVTKTQVQGGQQRIAIEQTDPNTVYVPYYDPNVVYGGWPYSSYPPYYWGYPGYIGAGLIATGLAFGTGWALGRWASGGNFWGGNINWSNNINNININRPRVNPLGGTNWQHRPEHRHGVRYSNAGVGQRFGNNNIRGGAQNRMDFRGRGGNQVLRPDGGRRGDGGRLGSVGSGRPGAGQLPARKPGAGNRPSQRPSAGQRPSSRPSAGQRRGGGNALGNIGSGRAANLQSSRGRASLGGGGGGGRIAAGGGGFRGGGGGGGFRGGGGGGFRGGGGGRRSDIAVKHDVVLLGQLGNGLGYYRFRYNGSARAYVGVIAQEVRQVVPDAVVRDAQGYLRVHYEKLGVKFQAYEKWIASGSRIPAIRASH